MIERLEQAGIRPTKIRLALASLLLDGEDRHVTVEEVSILARKTRIRTSIASVYNTLNQFAASGLVKKIIVDAGPVFFDTNTKNHYHIYHEGTGELRDIPSEGVEITGLPKIQRNQKITAIDITIRVTD